MDRQLFRLPDTERARLFEQATDRLARESDVAFAYVLGSSVTEPAFHDIDVAVCFSKPAADFTARALELSDDLTRQLGLPVEVGPLNDAPLAFVFHALQGQLLFSRDDERLADMIEDTVPRYLDVQPLVQRAIREAFES